MVGWLAEGRDGRRGISTDDDSLIDTHYTHEQTRPLTLILAVLMPLTGYVQVSAGLLQGAQDYAYQAR